jgi:hypothetical protein
VSPELDRLIRERRRVDALLRRGAKDNTPEEPLPDLASVFERIGQEIESLLGQAPPPEAPPPAPTAQGPSQPAGGRSSRPGVRRGPCPLLSGERNRAAAGSSGTVRG